MRRKDVKKVVAYYCAIPAMRRELTGERAELEREYDGLRAVPADAAPGASGAGRPAEELAGRIDERNVWGRLEAVGVRVQVLDADREKIQGCLNAINGEYTRLILRHYRDKYTWVTISVLTGKPERTIRRWHDKALDRLGEALEEVSMPDELLRRASRARV